MLRKLALASIAAASFGVALGGVPTSAAAEHWGGPRYGYGQHQGYGPPPWARYWGWRRHHHDGRPAYHGRRPGHFYGRPVPRHPYW